MIRNLKALSLALVAVFAMLALAASAAYATETHYRCGEGNEEHECTITYEADPTLPVQKFKTDVGTVECSEFHATATVKETFSSATLTGIEYKNCKVGGLTGTTVNFGECHYTIGGLAEFESMLRGNVTLGPAGCKVTIEVPKGKPKQCTITVEGEQTFANAITTTNVQTPEKFKEVTGHATTGEVIKYSYNGECSGGVKKEAADGKYEGTITARAYTLEGETKHEVNLTGI